MKLVFIVKGTSKHRKKISRTISDIRSSKHFSEVVIWVSDYAGHTIELAKTACVKFDYIVSVGGDGTLNEVVNGCLQAKDNDSLLTLPILGVLPQGTANDFVKTLALSGSEGELLQLIKNNHHNLVDVGKITYSGEGSLRLSRYFINIADVGIGANIAQSVNKSNKYFGSNTAFLLAIIKTFLSYKPRPLNIKTKDGFSWQGQALMLAIGNGRYFGSGLCIAPHAKISDGVFGVTLMGRMTIMDFILRFLDLKKDKKLDHPEMNYLEADYMEIDSSATDCAVEVDGEFLGFTPLQIEILPASISILMPR